MALTEKEFYAVGVLKTAAVTLDECADALAKEYGKSIPKIAEVRDTVKTVVDELPDKLGDALYDLASEINKSRGCGCETHEETIQDQWMTYRRWPKSE